MRGTLITAVVAVVAFVAGMEASAYRTGNLIVQRSADGECIAIDTVNAATLGTFPKSGDRCWLADWRMRHPL